MPSQYIQGTQWKRSHHQHQRISFIFFHAFSCFRQPTDMPKYGFLVQYNRTTIYLCTMHFMNSNTIILGQITVGLTLQLKGSVEPVLGGRKSGSESPHFPLGALELHAVRATFLLLKEKKQNMSFPSTTVVARSLGKVNKHIFTGDSATRGHSKPSGPCHRDPLPWPTPPESPLARNRGWHRSPVHPPGAFLPLLAPSKSSRSTGQKEDEIARSQAYVHTAKKERAKVQSLDYSLSTLIPFYSRVVLETPNGPSKIALGSKLPPHPGQSEIQCSSSFLICLEVHMYSGLHGGSHHPPFQSHADSLWMTTLRLSTNNNNVLQERRRQLWSDSTLGSMGLRVFAARDIGCP